MIYHEEESVLSRYKFFQTWKFFSTWIDSIQSLTKISAGYLEDIGKLIW
jgi:hypothetical protein